MKCRAPHPSHKLTGGALDVADLLFMEPVLAVVAAAVYGRSALRWATVSAMVSAMAWLLARATAWQWASRSVPVLPTAMESVWATGAAWRSAEASRLARVSGMPEESAS